MSARGVNEVILLGNLGTDPEVRYMPNGGAVTNIRLATTESWRDKSSGEQQERTEWHRVVFFNQLAEIAGKYLKKGDKAFVMGSIRTRKWRDENNQDRYSTEIVANKMQMLGKSGGRPDYAPAAGAGSQSSYAQPAHAPDETSTTAGQVMDRDNDDDIPF